MDAAYALAQNLVDVSYADIPRDVSEHARKHILDILGVMLGGSSRPGVGELAGLMREWGGKPESTVLCFGYKLPAPDAAQVNATMGHALDYDDTGDGPTHPSVVVVPTALAMAECTGGMSGRDFIAAVVLGMDMMCRLGRSFRLGLKSTPVGGHPGAGWHLTTLYGYLVAAAVAGRILGLDEKKLVNALGIAYHQCSGNGQCVNEGSLTKRMGPGFAARAGIMAAFLAGRGVTGAENCLEGELGIFNLYHGGKYDAGSLTADLGKSFAGTSAAMKPYPCCRGAHDSVSLAEAMVGKHDIRPEDIEEITIFCPDATSFLLSPLEKRSRPENPVDAQFSIPWGVGAVFARRRASIGDYTEEAIRSRDILDVTARIRIREDSSLTKGQDSAVRISVKMKDGRAFTGQPETSLDISGPLPWGEYERKFRDCASYSIQPLSEKQLDLVIGKIRRLDRIDDVRDIIAILS
ncbi:MAG: hypothetical protein A2Z29_09100 [Chloroflexi bacterium RBG_16_56_11]|nr:MAG: hypothetical protein A2Z29_09100 [Chloroflexi bacterium RBG_16_56_11]